MVRVGFVLVCPCQRQHPASDVELRNIHRLLHEVRGLHPRLCSCQLQLPASTMQFQSSVCPCQRQLPPSKVQLLHCRLLLHNAMECTRLTAALLVGASLQQATHVATATPGRVQRRVPITVTRIGISNGISEKPTTSSRLPGSAASRNCQSTLLRIWSIPSAFRSQHTIILGGTPLRGQPPPQLHIEFGQSGGWIVFSVSLFVLIHLSI